MESTSLQVEGGDRIFCEAVGSGDTIVFTHDALAHRETWADQFAAFGSDYRVVRWDRRGYGRSNSPDSPYSSVDDLARVVRAHSAGPAALVGCSYGAMLSLHCALDYPDLVSALVLEGPVVSGLAFTEHFATRGGRLTRSDLSGHELIKYFSEDDPWTIAPDNVAARSRFRELLTANPHNLQPHLEPAGPERFPQPPALSRLGEISVPTLVIAGEVDIPDVHAHCGAIAAAVAGARRVVLPGGGHLSHMDRPEEFNRTVLDFLAAHRA